jgi:hypothetical protein
MSQNKELELIILLDFDGTSDQTRSDVVPALKAIKEKNPAQRIILATSSEDIYRTSSFSRDGRFSSDFSIEQGNVLKSILELKGFMGPFYREVDFTRDDYLRIDHETRSLYPGAVGSDKRIISFMPQKEWMPFKDNKQFPVRAAEQLGVEPRQLLLIDDSSKNRAPLAMCGGAVLNPNNIDQLEDLIAQRKALLNAQTNSADIVDNTTIQQAAKMTMAPGTV